jgi:hypothetical protein
MYCIVGVLFHVLFQMNDRIVIYRGIVRNISVALIFKISDACMYVLKIDVYKCLADTIVRVTKVCVSVCLVTYFRHVG